MTSTQPADGPVGIGLDFGTTNSALALADGDGRTHVVRFASDTGPTPAFRSILFFGREEPDAPLRCEAGPRALALALEPFEERRLMQSLKSFLASALFQGTVVFGRRTDLEDLVARILRPLRREALEAGHRLPGPVVVGRPVCFAKAETEADDARAERRLRAALDQAGFHDTVFEFEPVAAAYHYESALERDELVLIGDFGGGTSDFCLLPVGPSYRARPRRAADIAGTEGVAIAGDAFDARIVRHRVAPQLGRGGEQRSPFGKRVPIPNWIYGELERWHHLSFLKTHENLGLLMELERAACEPEKLAALRHLVEADLGYPLYRAVEATKSALSREAASPLRFEDGPVQIDAAVTRNEFEAWIAPELERIEAAVDRLLERTGTATAAVDAVFLTGGSSFVPAVRELFRRRFGPERLRRGDELTSVASGLALRARDLQRS